MGSVITLISHPQRAIDVENVAMGLMLVEQCLVDGPRKKGDRSRRLVEHFQIRYGHGRLYFNLTSFLTS
jgi:hypothetical protein